MKDTVFYFEFCLWDDPNNEKQFNKGFIIKDYEYLTDDEDKAYASVKICEDIECEYGKHDWCNSPDDRVDGIGYSSSEVEENRIDELMEVWRQVFIKEGADVTDVVQFELLEEDRENDYDIYLKVKGLPND